MVQTRVWGDYEIHLDQVLGRGGMGTVYRGRQVSLNRLVAIKTLKKELSNPDFIKRFSRESALLARLVDQHIVQVFGAGEGDGAPFYAMEFVEGEDLASMLRSGKKFSTDEILDIAIQTGLALKAAWKLKIVHRDIKPSNILVTRDKVVKVMDFGLAKNPDMDLTRTEMIMGTAKYISPEQATGGEVDIRADLYSLGCVLYELATGSAPFTGDSPTSIIYQHVHKTAVPPKKLNPQLPDSMQGMILRCLSKRADERYQAPDDLIADARAIQGGVSPDERTVLLAQTSPTLDAIERTTLVKPAAAPEGESRAGLFMSLALVVVVLGVVGYFVIKAIGADPVRTGGVAVTDGGAATTTPVAATTTAPGGETTTVVPHVPVPVPADRFEELLAKAGRDFEASRYMEARDAYLELRQSFKKEEPKYAEFQAKVDICDAKLLIARAEGVEAGNVEQAIEYYGQAIEKLPEAHPDRTEYRERRKRLLFTKFRDSGSRSMGKKEWELAARDFAEAQAHAGDERSKKEMADREEFCRRYQEAIRALLSEKPDHARVVELFRSLRSSQFGHAFEEDILKRIGECETALSSSKEEREKTYRRCYGQAQDYFIHRGNFRKAWEEIKLAKAQGVATDEPFESLYLELEAYSKAPPGMIWLPAGKFELGAGDAREVEGPAQSVFTEAFYIDAREVTVDQYAVFLDAYKGHELCAPGEDGAKSHRPQRWGDQLLTERAPVTDVDWFDAYAYAAWAKKRLPTEIEWERAAGTELVGGPKRIFAKRVYPWEGGYSRTAEDRSPCGTLGMGMGIYDWTSSEFVKYKGGEARDSRFYPGQRVVRGGVDPNSSLEEMEDESKVSHRTPKKPDQPYRNVGIRCAKSVEK